MADPYSGLFAQGEPRGDAFDTARSVFYSMPWIIGEFALPLGLSSMAGFGGLHKALQANPGRAAAMVPTISSRRIMTTPGYDPGLGMFPPQWETARMPGMVRRPGVSYFRNFARDALKFERQHVARIGGRAQGGKAAWELYSHQLQRNPQAAIQAATGTEIKKGARASRRYLTERYGQGVASKISAARFGRAVGRLGAIGFAIDIGLMAFNMMGGQQGGPTELGPSPRFEPETGGDFVDTRLAQTQRSRALQAIHNSHLTTRAVFGNEASMIHYNS